MVNQCGSKREREVCPIPRIYSLKLAATEVPFADHRRSIAGCLSAREETKARHHPANPACRVFVGGKMRDIPMDAMPPGKQTGDRRSTRRRADAMTDVELGEARTLCPKTKLGSTLPSNATGTSERFGSSTEVRSTHSRSTPILQPAGGLRKAAVESPSEKEMGTDDMGRRKQLASQPTLLPAGRNIGRACRPTDADLENARSLLSIREKCSSPLRSERETRRPCQT